MEGWRDERRAESCELSVVSSQLFFIVLIRLIMLISVIRVPSNP